MCVRVGEFSSVVVQHTLDPSDCWQCGSCVGFLTTDAVAVFELPLGKVREILTTGT